ncbi:MAG: type II toxin-antitoxin system HicA family toxin [Pseudonocardiales bacterium]
MPCSASSRAAWFRHPTKPGTVTVAGKPSTDIPTGTERNIRKQAGIRGGSE